MDSHKEHGANLTRLVLATGCELRQHALRANQDTAFYWRGLYNLEKSANLRW